MDRKQGSKNISLLKFQSFWQNLGFISFPDKKYVLDKFFAIYFGVQVETKLGGCAIYHFAIDAHRKVGQESVKQHLCWCILRISVFKVVWKIIILKYVRHSTLNNFYLLWYRGAYSDNPPTDNPPSYDNPPTDDPPTRQSADIKIESNSVITNKIIYLVGLGDFYYNFSRLQWTKPGCSEQNLAKVSLKLRNLGKILIKIDENIFFSTKKCSIDHLLIVSNLEKQLICCF